MGLKYVFVEMFSLFIQWDVKDQRLRLAEFVFSDKGLYQRLPLYYYNSLAIIAGKIDYATF